PVLQPDGAGGLQVLPQRREIEAVEVVVGNGQQVQRLTLLEPREYRIEHLVILVARDRPRHAEADRALRQVVQQLDHRSTRLCRPASSRADRTRAATVSI